MISSDKERIRSGFFNHLLGTAVKITAEFLRDRDNIDDESFFNTVTCEETSDDIVYNWSETVWQLMSAATLSREQILCKLIDIALQQEGPRFLLKLDEGDLQAIEGTLAGRHS